MSSPRYFVKLHSTIIDSSLWQEPYSVRLAFLTLCALADADGFVYSLTPAKLARRANITPDESREAIRVLSEPDPESGRTVEDGRRIIVGVGDDSVRFIRVVNKRHYEELGQKESVRFAETARKASQRARKAEEEQTSSLIADDWAPSPETVGAIEMRGRQASWITAQVEKFRLYKQSQGAIAADWGKAFQLWCTNEIVHEQKAEAKAVGYKKMLPNGNHLDAAGVERTPEGVAVAKMSR